MKQIKVAVYVGRRRIASKRDESSAGRHCWWRDPAHAQHAARYDARAARRSTQQENEEKRNSEERRRRQQQEVKEMKEEEEENEKRGARSSSSSF